MGDIRRRQQQQADALYAGLEATAGDLAKAQPRRHSTAPSQEQVLAIKLLAKLGETLPEFCRQAFLGELGAGEWDDMHKSVSAAARVMGEYRDAPTVIDAEE